MGGMKTQPPELKKFMDKKLSGKAFTARFVGLIMDHFGLRVATWMHSACLLRF